jgi:uncharacterized surface protein with fasciclin (FAS1) repeats
MLIVLVALAVLASVAMPAFAQGMAQKGMSGQASQNKIISALQSKSDLSQFTNALEQTGLDKTLSSGGKYTVFAPTNNAFSQMPANKASIMNQNKQGMEYVLKYHVVKGKMLPQQLKTTSTLMTLNNRNVPVSMAGNQIMVDGARITGEGIDTGNVMIYPINAVMIPPMLT